MTLRAKELGATASLQVAPYYNKPTQEGLLAHYCAVGEATELPVVLWATDGDQFRHRRHFHTTGQNQPDQAAHRQSTYHGQGRQDLVEEEGRHHGEQHSGRRHPVSATGRCRRLQALHPQYEE